MKNRNNYDCIVIHGDKNFLQKAEDIILKNGFLKNEIYFDKDKLLHTYNELFIRLSLTGMTNLEKNHFWYFQSSDREFGSKDFVIEQSNVALEELEQTILKIAAKHIKEYL